MPKYFLTAILVAAALLIGKPASDQSFDCRKNKNADERTICASRDLAELDVRMSSEYFRLLNTLSGSARDRLQVQQKEWLTHRRNCGSAVRCLLNRHEERLDELGAYALAHPGEYESAGELLSHNGSTMALLVEGSSRKIVYRFPRTAMVALGVQSGTVVFEGLETRGGYYSGTAYLFKRDCAPIPYHVEGSMQWSNRGELQLILQGAAPDEYLGCQPFRYSWTHNSILIFDYLRGEGD
jgi:uncharacterized protein YecT (DUF1311 family)